MKTIAAIFIFSLCLAGVGNAQEKAKNILLFNAAGNSITLGSPVAVTNNTILFPGTLGLQGALMYISSIAGSIGTTTWLNPGTNGFMLTLSSGNPTWSDPALILGSSYWSLSGNATTSAYNGAAGSFLGTTSLFPLVLAATNATSQPIEFFNGGLERMRIASTGELLVGTTTPVSTVTVNGEVYSNSLRANATLGKPAYTEARVFYDTSEKTMAYYNDHNGVTLNIGQEEWIRVKNVSGASIANGNAVYINGNDVATGLPTIALAKSDALATSEGIGICTETIPNNSTGYVTAFGIVHQLNTSAYSAGQALYVSPTTAGTLTGTRPLSPNFTTPVGYVAFVDAALGKILVRPGNTRFGLFTAGAIAFAGSDGWLKQSTSNFFFDSTNSRLGIGTNTPGQSLEIKNGSLLLSNTGAATQIQLQGTSTGISTFQAGAQGATNINYTLPTTLTATSTVGTGILQYTGTGALQWIKPASLVSGSGWSTTGNAGTIPGVAANQNYIGTSDAQNMIFATNATERMRILSTGNVSLNSATAPQLFTIGGDIGIVGTGSKITSSSTAKELIMEQTVDTYGTSRLRMQHRNGSNGALFETITGPGFSGIDLVDFGFKPGAGVQSNIRLEARAGTIRNSGNTVGEFEFYMDPTGAGQTYVMSVGKASTTIEVGNVGIGLVNPTSPLHIITGNTASGGYGMGANFNQTITAAANNDSLYGVSITPTFTNGAFTGLNNFALRVVYNGTLANGAAIRGKASGNGGASSEVIGVWGIATDATQGSNTNAGVGVRAEGNNTTTDLNSNIALQVVNGGFIVGRQASSALNDNTAINNILAEDDANGLTDQGPSGVVDVTVNAAAAASVSLGTLVVDNRYAKSTSIVLLTPMNGGTSAPNGNESVSTRVTARGTGTFTIEVRRTNPTAAAGGTNGTVRVGFLIVNPGK